MRVSRWARWRWKRLSDWQRRQKLIDAHERLAEAQEKYTFAAEQLTVTLATESRLWPQGGDPHAPE